MQETKKPLFTPLKRLSLYPETKVETVAITHSPLQGPPGRLASPSVDRVTVSPAHHESRPFQGDLEPDDDL